MRKSATFCGTFTVINAIDPAVSEQFHSQAVEVFRPGAYDDLVGLYTDAPVAGQIAPDGFTQLEAAGIGRTDEDLFPVFGQHAAHDAGQRGDIWW